MKTHTRLIAMVGVLAAVESANAHVTLDTPNGGEMLDPGDDYQIEWHVEIQHDTIAWDVEYSTDGGTSWQDIAIALAPGDITTGAMHSFPWVVPDEPSSQVRVRVKQDNTGRDYYDTSDADLSIVPEPGVSALAIGVVSLFAHRRRRSP